MSGHVRKPEWLKISIASNERYAETKRIVESHCLHTICSSGRCPNMGECWGRGTATFMIGGDICTRCCKFCNTQTGKPLPLDEGEPLHVAESVRLMKLSHAVITSVDRDDLPDLGAAHWARTITEIRRLNPDTTIEVLIPDFQGRKELVQQVIDAQPDILFIGEAPGADEDRQGIPFIGRAGQLLTKMIEAMGYTRDEVFIANIIKCRPPANRTPTPDEMRLCMPYLRRQIELIRPKVIVALGSTACKGLCEQQGTFSTVRGIWQTFGKIPVMPTFHPAYVLRVPSVKRTVWQDLQAVLARLGRPVPPVRAAAPTAKG